MFKNTFIKAILFLIISALIAGCHLFTEGQKKLAIYCPGLTISLDSVGYDDYTNFDLSKRSTYVIKYESYDEDTASDYFLNRSNGFTPKKGNLFFNLEMDDNRFLETDDVAVGRKFKLGKNYSWVIFKQTKHIIVIAEYTL